VCQAAECPHPKLPALVGEYLESKDESSRPALAKRIGALADGSFDTVRRAVRQHLTTFEPAGTGTITGDAVAADGAIVGEYALHVPETYDPTTPHPLILALAGGRGDGKRYLPTWRKLVKGTNWIVLCPVSGGFAWWRSGYIVALAALRNVLGRYHVNRNRIYVTGMSNGGNGTWYLAVHYPELFAAAAPMAGCPATGPGRMDFRFLDNLLNLPIYFVHGVRDQTISIEPERKAARILRGMGYDFIFREIPQGGHGSPQGHAAEILKWFAGKKRTPNPGKLKHFKRSAEEKSCYWLRLNRTRRSARVEAVASANTIAIRATNVRCLTVYLSEALVDLGKPLTVKVGSQTVFSGTRTHDINVLLETARLFRDPDRLYAAKVAVCAQVEHSRSRNPPIRRLCRRLSRRGAQEAYGDLYAP